MSVVGATEGEALLPAVKKHESRVIVCCLPLTQLETQVGDVVLARITKVNPRYATYV